MFDMMAKGCKNKTGAPWSGKDCICVLCPDELLHQVLSLLPADEAMRTFMLSHQYVGPGTWFKSLEKYNKCVNNLIFFCELSPLIDCEFNPYPDVSPYEHFYMLRR
ncbi:hypothetical protein BRADI_4g23252v3 [Brachypodium distachyon]|uniref:F-box domain-containing protein n=1 Tax=Brachypodium distachyon TaxID=15368 RepID=A0A2K2CPL6_BRADI|nr:hypothetical protein BRADI_4g23252v3 [Brachypodium distachyon]